MIIPISFQDMHFGVKNHDWMQNPLKPRPQEPPPPVRAARPAVDPSQPSKRAPEPVSREPWCLRRRTCKAGAFSYGFWQTGHFLGVPGLAGLGAGHEIELAPA